MSYFSAHHAEVARKSSTGKIVLPETAELRCSCKTIWSYEQIRRGPMYPCVLRKMIQKFKITGQFGILPGRGRMQIPSSSVEDVATAVIEASSQSSHGSVNVPVVSRAFYMTYSTVPKILWRILNFYPCKIKPVHLLQDGDSEVRTTFAVEFLARMMVDVTWPWNIPWSYDTH
ncbi:hypothetical protein AVEN_85055-1 [Araneus ventricosus]|uniref:DUF4817 domain-containing protein n=1 Tax=Araneus ventricosus TaxID=182803 RepID=A0A4Y2ES79_ARAVE|nr:hypothetical protein AVEN_85055-1 [Araneus ventricosus]